MDFGSTSAVVAPPVLDSAGSDARAAATVAAALAAAASAEDDLVLEVPAPSAVQLDTADFVAARERKYELQMSSQKAQRIRAVNVAELPETYRTVSPKEQQVIAHANKFREQFETLYPQRRPLFLCAKNEGGVMKFVSTTIRPTQLAFKDFYSLQGCASFVAQYLTYEPLADPEEPPAFLVSPGMTLATRSGDCFDYSTLLCSLLLGAGYDAYVVYGYATKRLTLKDEERMMPPPIQHESQEEAPPPPPVDTRYRPSALPKLSSRFLQQQAEREALRRKQSEPPKPPTESDEEPDLTDVHEDPLLGRRVHSWVLVRANKRDLTESIFIEPAMGTVHPTSDANFLGIESLWNPTNYWINMQEVPAPQISFDLWDSSKWEYVFVENIRTSTGLVQEQLAQLAATDDTPVDLAVTVSRQKDGDTVDIPPSWAQKLSVSKETFLGRRPTCTKTVLFFKYKLELFEELTRADGLVRRQTRYRDKARTVVEECLELYSYRSDHLVSVSSFPRQGKTVFRYDRGREDGLQSFTYIRDRWRQLLFYPDSGRTDYLISRTDEVGDKIKTTERFANREDRLVYRSVRYGFPSLGADSGSTRNPAVQRRVEMSMFQLKLNQPTRLKITQKFARNPAVKADADIECIKFLYEQDKFLVRYHHGEGCITASSRLISRVPVGSTVGHTDLVVVDPFAHMPHEDELADQYDWLDAQDKLAQKNVELGTGEINRLLLNLQESYVRCDLVRGVYDSARDQAQRRQQEAEAAKAAQQAAEQSSSRRDFLASYLPENFTGGALSYDEAMKVRDLYMEAVRQKLQSKSNIILSRLRTETEELQKKQATYHNNKEHFSKDEHDAYILYCNEAILRINVLEKRFHEHREFSHKKFREEFERLINDPRMAALRTGK